MYAKGTRYFEDTPVPDAAMEDIDLGFVKAYTEKLGYRKSPEEYLRENKEFVSEKGGGADYLLAALFRSVSFPAPASALSDMRVRRRRSARR